MTRPPNTDELIGVTTSGKISLHFAKYDAMPTRLRGVVFGFFIERRQNENGSLSVKFIAPMYATVEAYADRVAVGLRQSGWTVEMHPNRYGFDALWSEGVGVAESARQATGTAESERVEAVLDTIRKATGST